MSIHEFCRLKALITLEQGNTTELSRKDKNLNWQNCHGRKPHMFCEEILGKMKFRAFPKHVDPRILSLESVDDFGTSKHY